MQFISQLMQFDNEIYPVHDANLTLIQHMWSANPFHLVFLIWYPYHLVFLKWQCCRHLSINAIALDAALLSAVKDAPFSRGPLLWRHNAMAVIVSWNTRGPERDTYQPSGNANSRRSRAVNRSIICWIFLLNDFIYIIRHNCRAGTTLGYSINAGAVLGSSALGHLIEPVARLTSHAHAGVNNSLLNRFINY